MCSPSSCLYLSLSKDHFVKEVHVLVWWYTIMAHTEVMQQIVDASGAKASWSLRSPLATHSLSQDVGQQSSTASQIWFRLTCHVPHP